MQTTLILIYLSLILSKPPFLLIVVLLQSTDCDSTFLRFYRFDLLLSLVVGCWTSEYIGSVNYIL